MMDTKEIRRLLREGHSVVLLEEGQPPLLVTELKDTEPVQEVPISARWPKIRPLQEVGSPEQTASRQEHILERLNKEILALKAQIEQEEVNV